MKKYNLFIFIILFSVFLAAVLSQQIAGGGRVVYGVKNLQDFLPKTDVRLKVVDLPLGGTESLDAEVGKTLAYDDYVYRSYEYNGRIFNVLIFYWKPGKMQPRLVSSHTPDACWVRAGMKTLNANSFEKLKSRNLDFITSQGRVFESNGEVVYVSYWHLVGGKTFGYGTSYQPPWYSIFTDVIKYGLKMKADQIYVRIHSSEKIAEIMKDDAFYPVIKRLAELGLVTSDQKE
ncbi:MAG: hypothetical protein JF609_05375 [Verrucomicrobia bacterium]|nr:hypothetical protein [Verrucomicrobiota bacterium]